METTNLKNRQPKTVFAVAEVKMVLVSYVDESGREVTQPAIVGKNNATMLNAADFGFSRTSTPVGAARDWLLRGIKEGLGEEVPEKALKKTPKKAEPKKVAKP